MRINFDTKILDHKGKEIPEDKDVMTLASVVATSLLMFIDQDRNLKGKDKSRRFKLAMRAADGGVQDLSITDVNTILERVGETQSTLICGRVYEILDPELKEVESENNKSA